MPVQVNGGRVRFALPDPRARLRAVRLWHELAAWLDQRENGWRLPRPHALPPVRELLPPARGALRAQVLAVRPHLLAARLDVPLHEVRNAHNWTAWRDALDPHLAELVARVRA